MANKKRNFPHLSFASLLMLSRSLALRLHVESALAGRVSSPFRFHQPRPVTASTGIAALDQLAGGLPRGGLTEIYGALSSGIASLLQTTLAARTANAEACALVDAQDSFDPRGAECTGVALRRLLWVRCRTVDQALRSVDLLLHGGGFSLVAVDLSGAPEKLVRQIPLNFWFRLRRTVENTPTILLVLARQSHAKTCASLVLRLERASARWSPDVCRYPSRDFHAHSSLLDGWTVHAEMIRSALPGSSADFSPETSARPVAAVFRPRASANDHHKTSQERTSNLG